jgi:hypothetical protein
MIRSPARGRNASNSAASKWRLREMVTIDLFENSDPALLRQHRNTASKHGGGRFSRYMLMHLALSGVSLKKRWS